MFWAIWGPIFAVLTVIATVLGILADSSDLLKRDELPKGAVYYLVPSDLRRDAIGTDPRESFSEFLRRYYGLGGRPRGGDSEAIALDGNTIKWVAYVGDVQRVVQSLIVLQPLDGQAHARIQADNIRLGARYAAPFGPTMGDLEVGSKVLVTGVFHWEGALEKSYIIGQRLGVSR